MALRGARRALAMGVIGGGAALPFPRTISGLQLWLDASDPTTLYQDSALTTLAAANDDPVGGWRDKSGNNRHALQTGAATLKPTLKTNQLNSLPTVYFDGGDALVFLSGITPVPCTIFAVVLIADNGSARTIISGFTNSLDYRFSALKQQLVKSNVDVVGTGTGAKLTDTYYLLAATYDGANYVFRTNGAADGNGAKTLAITATVDTVGKLSNTTSDYYLGNIAELLYYNSVLSAENIAAIEAYLDEKWSVLP